MGTHLLMVTANRLAIVVEVIVKTVCHWERSAPHQTRSQVIAQRVVTAAGLPVMASVLIHLPVISIAMQMKTVKTQKPVQGREFAQAVSVSVIRRQNVTIPVLTSTLPSTIAVYVKPIVQNSPDGLTVTVKMDYVMPLNVKIPISLALR